MILHQFEPQKAYLIAVHRKEDDVRLAMESLKELGALATTLDLVIIGETYQSRPHPDPKSFVGMGKLEEIKTSIEEAECDYALFDAELSPNQGKFLENYLGCMVLDRTQVILEIFAKHARTPEAKAQVELAQLKYMLPRLVGMWAHLDREKGGIGANRSAGEKQINIDRTLIRNKITRLEEKLVQVEKERKIQSKRRQEHFTMALVGYTNAGKTTLMDLLTHAGLKGENKLFATLESTTRILEGIIKPDILLSDTVGFIQNLPHNLVASFRSTLSVVLEADLLLHVVDASSGMLMEQVETTQAVLKEIGAERVPRLIVVNKMDLIPDRVEEMILKKSFPNAVFVSNLLPETIVDLRAKIQEYFLALLQRREVVLGYNQGGLVPKFYELALVEEVKYEEERILLRYAATESNQRQLEEWLQKSMSHLEEE